ncbi:hypothetical protein D9M72_636940 [compost metagenome]
MCAMDETLRGELPVTARISSCAADNAKSVIDLDKGIAFRSSLELKRPVVGDAAVVNDTGVRRGVIVDRHNGRRQRLCQVDGNI